MNFENLRDAILREAEGGPTQILDADVIDQRDGESFSDAVARFCDAHPGAIYSEASEEGDMFLCVPQEPCPPWSTLYVGVFEVERCYGGPEEGGWWYDAGTLKDFEPVRVRFDEDRKPYFTESELEFLKELCEKLCKEYPFGTNHRSSMAPRGEDYSWGVSWNVPKDFPQQRPYYS